MREDWSDRSMSFIVVSSTGCPEIGNAGIEDCSEAIVLLLCRLVLTVDVAW